MLARPALAAAALVALVAPALTGSAIPVANEAPWGFWHLAIIQGGATPSGFSVDVGSDGTTYVAWSKSHVYYARYNGVTLSKEQVTTGIGTRVWGLALDSADRPHIAFYAIGSNPPPDRANLQYLHFDGTSWQREIVDSTLNAGAYARLRVGSDDLPRIVYRTPSTTDSLNYAWKDAQGWHTERIDTLGSPWFDFDLDANNVPHVALGVGTGMWGQAAYYQRVGPGVWTKEIADTVGGTDISLAVDDLGRTHLAYRDEGETLGYALKGPQGWQLQTIDSNGASGYATSIDTDPLNRPHITYTNGPPQYKTIGPTNEWIGESIDPIGSVLDWTQIRVDAHGRPHVVYQTDSSTATLAEPLAVQVMRPIGG